MTSTITDRRFGLSSFGGIGWLYSTTTTMAAPGTGYLRLNSATMSAVTSMAISALSSESDNPDVSDFVTTWDDSTSTDHRGILIVRQAARPEIFAIFDITNALTDNSTWLQLTVTYVTHSGTFEDNAVLAVAFVRTGPAGAAGADGGGFTYTFNSATSGDPASGKFLFNNATFGSASAMNISETDGNSNGLSVLLATLDDSTSTNKCLLVFRKSGGTALFLAYVTGNLTDNGLYDTFSITPIATTGSISSGDQFSFTPVRTGDKGTTGDTGSAGGTGPSGPTSGILQAYSTTTADADPGAGTFRLNNATPASATAAYLDNLDSGASTVSTVFDLWDDSTNTVKGVVRFEKSTDPTIWASFQVTGSVTDGTGYRKLTLANGAGSGAFTNGNTFAITFFRAGDKGSDGLGSGDVTAAASIDDLAIVIGDGGVKGIKKSTISVAGGNNVSNVGTLTTTGLITGSKAGVAARFLNTTDSASVQVAKFEGDRATMADNDEAYISYLISDDGGTQTEVGRLTWIATDVNAGTNVDSAITWSEMTAGVLAAKVRLEDSVLSPAASDGTALGSTTYYWSDLFLASGGVVNFNSDVTITHSTDLLTFAGATLYKFDAPPAPNASDGAALGSSSLQWSDLFLASGAVINFSNSDYTITHSTGALTLSGTLSLGTSNAFTCGTIELGAAADTTLGRGAAGVMAVEGVNLYPNIPISSKSAAYPIVLADANTCIYHPIGDNNPRTFTIPAEGSINFPLGTFLTFINGIGTVTIAITSDALILAGTGSSGSRTLAAHGVATAIKVESARWIINGTGLT